MSAKTAIVHQSKKFAKARTTNATDTSFASKVPTTTKPSGEGVINLKREARASQWVELVPYGTGDANDVFEMWVIGWREIDGLWVPKRLVKLTCTLGAMTGVAGASVLATELFCDTVTASMGISNVSYELYSPADDTACHVKVQTGGNELLELIFDATTGDPTGMNCLVAFV